MSSFTLHTPHGLISIIDTALKNDSPSLLLIHGNSSSSKIFRHILESRSLTSKNRIITFDLPGHGSSSKAPRPDKSYSIQAYADLAVTILQHLSIESVVLFGWSIGGHVALEMVRHMRSPGVLANNKRIELSGVMISGAPPASRAVDVTQAFRPNGPGLALSGLKDWTDEQACDFAQLSAGRERCWEQWMWDDARQTDGRARMMVNQRFGQGEDQRDVVEEEDVCVAVVNGAEDQFVRLGYFEDVRWRNLWRGECVRVEGCHHTPFWERPEDFERLLREFLDDVERGDGGVDCKGVQVRVIHPVD